MHVGPVGPKRKSSPDGREDRKEKSGIDRAGYRKESTYQRVKSGGAVGDPSMAEGEAWTQAGAGVDESVVDVGAMPNDSIMKPESDNLI